MGFFKKHFVLFSLALSLILPMASANAVLNVGVSTAFTSLKTDFDSLISLAYPVMIAIVVALTIFGLVKSFIRRSAS